MFRDFTKLETFLTVIREKSFSKASKTLGISQPAVTQQIKYIEDCLKTDIVTRNKTGIKPTNNGKILYDIALKLESCIIEAQKNIQNMTNETISFNISSCFIIGNYILPNYLNKIEKRFGQNISIQLSTSTNQIQDLLNNKIDIALVDNKAKDNDIIYEEWIDDEIVIFSNQKLPTYPTKEDLLSYKWICRNPKSSTRKIFQKHLQNASYPNCETFNIAKEITSSSIILQTILHSNKQEIPTTSIISRKAIESLLKSKALFEARLPNEKMNSKLYIAYKKNNKHHDIAKRIISCLKED